MRDPAIPAQAIDSAATDDDFDRWITQRSFALLTPICKLATVIALAMLVLTDPIFYARGFWSKNPDYVTLAVWHLSIALFFGAMLGIVRVTQTPSGQRKALQFFIVGGAALFTWFGVISWMLIGDFSTYAIFTLGLACVFCFPGHLRRVVYVTSALVQVVVIAAIDPRGTFMETGVFVNLGVVVAVAFVIDGYMMKNSLELFRNQRRVEIERARADTVLYNALPMSIANELKRNNTVKAEKYQNMTVLFADIVGFTKFSSSVPPDALIHVLNQIFSTFDDLVETQPVEKIKTIGDAYMVIGKDNAVAVGNLALEMLKAMATYNALNGVNFELRIGIHIGPTVAGVIGIKRFLYDVWGDAVNTASRMESTGIPGRIHVSEPYRKELGTAFEFEDRGEMEIKGKGVMHTYFLLSPAPVASP